MWELTNGIEKISNPSGNFSFPQRMMREGNIKINNNLEDLFSRVVSLVGQCREEMKEWISNKIQKIYFCISRPILGKDVWQRWKNFLCDTFQPLGLLHPMKS